MSKLKKTCCGLCSFLLIVLSCILVLGLVTIIRALIIEEPDFQEYDLPINEKYEVTDEFLHGVPLLLGEALTHQTVSYSPHNYNTTELLRFHGFLERNFPNVYESKIVTVETINTYSLLYSIQGTDDTLEPYLLCAHMDVVPVDSDLWELPPFLGEIVEHPQTGENVVWGRGAIDDKASVITILSALEYLLSTEWIPKRTFYIGFGHDEEVGGKDGAKVISETLQERNVTLAFLLDEGMPILDGVMKGIDVPVATIGVTEKGWMNVHVKAKGTGGHSSIPPMDQAVSRLAKAVRSLYDYPQPSMFGKGPEIDMFNFIAPKANWPYKLLYANTWLFKPVLEFVMLKSRETAAIIRTTTAVTIMKAGIKDNVIPSSGEALINHRIHPGQSIEDVLQHDRNVINDPTVELVVEGSREAHPISPYGPDAFGFRLIASTIKKLFHDAVPVPSILVANTDTRHYLSLCQDTCAYRFNPFVLTKSDLARIHGRDESISVKNVISATKFYHHLMLFADIENSVDVPVLD